MEESNLSLVNFNEMTNELLQTFNPNTAKEQAKELGANLLLMIGVPFFLERLKEKLPEDLFTKLSELAKDPENFGANSLKLAKELFDEKIVQPLKGQLLKQMDEYIPALKNLSDIDLSKLSVKDVQDLFTKQLIQKMKDNLPPEIASKLPENFTQEDILNSLKDLSKDQALKFAKDNLPPEAYNMLEQNQNLLTDPTKLSDFMKGKFDEASSKLSDTVSQFKSEAYTRLNEIKDNIKNEIDKNVQPFKDKIEELKKSKQTIQDQLQAGKEDIDARYNDLSDRLRQMKANNPDYTAEDIQPFKDTRDALKLEANNLKTKTTQDLGDIDSQINDNNSTIEDITNNLVQKAYNLRNTLTSGVDTFTQNTKAKFQEGIQKGQELQQNLEQTVQDAKDTANTYEAEGRGLTRKAVENIKKTQRAFIPEEEETGEITQPESVFGRIGSFLGFKKTPAEQLLSREKPNLQYTMSSPDELESPFSMRALDTPNNRILLRYRAMENSDVTFDDNNSVRFAEYKPVPKQTTFKLSKEQAPQFDPEAQARAQRLRVETGEQGTRIPEPQQVLPTQPKPAQQPPVSEIEPAATEQLGTPAPEPTTITPSTELGEQTGETFGSSIEKLASTVQSTATKATEGFSNIRQGLSKIAVEGLDEAAVATEDVPVLDVVMDIAGLFGTIFGAKSLMSQKAPPQPMEAGESYEPDL